MPRSSKRVLNPKAERALDSFKYEVADELGISDKLQSVGWANMTSRECGSVGGMMVKKMIEFAEEHMAKDPSAVTGPTGADRTANK